MIAGLMWPPARKTHSRRHIQEDIEKAAGATLRQGRLWPQQQQQQQQQPSQTEVRQAANSTYNTKQCVPECMPVVRVAVG